jgi:hypothetical protein
MQKLRPSRLLLSGALAVGILVPALTVTGSLFPVTSAEAGTAAPPVVNVAMSGRVGANTFIRMAGARAGSGISEVVNSNFAGYLTTSAPNSIQAAFRVPSLLCPASGSFETAAGAEVQGPIGSSVSFENADLYMFCNNGTPSYSGSFVYGTSSAPTTTSWTFTPHPLDKIKLKITTGATFTEVAKDVTHPATSTVSGVCTACGGSEANVSMDIGPVTPFGSLTWKNVRVDGGTLASSTPTAYQDVNGSDVLITTSPISTGGTSFTNTFVASS